MPLRPEPAPAPPPRRAGFALPMLMAALALGGIVAGVIGSGSVLLARMSREALYSDTARMVVKQATMRLVTESADIDNDGFPEPPAMDTAGSAKPAGGGNVPATSAAPKGDAWGTALGYCAWDNGGTSASAGRIDGDSPASQNSITLAVVSAGPDKSFQTSCAQARANAAQGDDIVMAYSNAQVVQGVGGTVYWGDPVTDYATLKKLVADEVQAGKVQAGAVQAARLNSGELALVLDGGAQQDLVDLPLQSSFTVVVSGPDGSFVHATVLNTGGLVQITAKHFSGLDLVAAGNRLRVVNTSVQTKRLTANWMRMG